MEMKIIIRINIGKDFGYKSLRLMRKLLEGRNLKVAEGIVIIIAMLIPFI